MSDRNVFDAIQTEPRPHYDSYDVDSSEDEYVPPESSDSEENILEEDLREQTDEEEVGDSDKEVQHKLCLQ